MSAGTTLITPETLLAYGGGIEAQTQVFDQLTRGHKIKPDATQPLLSRVFIIEIPKNAGHLTIKGDKRFFASRSEYPESYPDFIVQKTGYVVGVSSQVLVSVRPWLETGQIYLLEQAADLRFRLPSGSAWNPLMGNCSINGKPLEQKDIPVVPLAELERFQQSLPRTPDGR